MPLDSWCLPGDRHAVFGAVEEPGRRVHPRGHRLGAVLLVGLPQTQEVVGRWLGGYPEQLTASLSLLDQFETMTRGLIELRSLLFFTLFTVAWLIGGMIVLHQTKTA